MTSPLGRAFAALQDLLGALKGPLTNCWECGKRISRDDAVSDAGEYFCTEEHREKYIVSSSAW